MNQSEKEALGLFAILGALLIFPLASIWRGYVLTKLWAWFVVPAFGLAPIGVALAIGLAAIVTYLTVKPSKSDTSLEDFASGIVFSLIYPLMALVMGYVVQLFV